MLSHSSNVKFHPRLIDECESIDTAIKQVAFEFNKDPLSLDFDLRKISTYKRHLRDKPEFIPHNQAANFFANNLLEPNLNIFQRYSIFIKEKEKKEEFFELKVDDSFSQAFLIFKKGFRYEPSLFNALYEEINKAKARAKILIFGRLSNKIALKDFLSSLTYPLKQETQYLLIQGANFLPSVESRLEFKKDLKEKFQAVCEKDIVCVFYKALRGSPGRNLRGEYIIPQEPKTLHQSSSLKYDNAEIEAKDYPNAIHYVALKGGLLKYDKETLKIESVLETEVVSSKTTGSILLGKDSGITINITQKDSLGESVGQGVKIESFKVNVEGNVGANVQIDAQEVDIRGFTHQDSKIYADHATIKIHKGFIRAKSVKVKSLETGIIQAEHVEVERMYGGKIYAQEIIIETLHANAFLYATKNIKVYLMEKGENRFFIASNYSPSLKQQQDSLIEKKNDLVEKITRLGQELEMQNLELKQLKPAADEARKTLLAYKQNGNKPPSYLLDKFQIYHKMVIDFKQKKEKLDLLNANFEECVQALKDFDQSVQNAVVEIESGWVGYNEVHYCFYHPAHELTLIPKQGEPHKVSFDSRTQKLVLWR
ncbi:MAG: hypothetical protein K2I63_03620 [Helicobacter sp.]|nr:hypothetical protein [Helicobacter sp.]